MLYKKIYKNLTLSFVLIFIILVFVSCNKNITGNDSYIKIRLDSDPTTLDPAYIVDVTGGNISAKIYNCLVKYDENMNIIGDLAEKYEVSEDGLRYTFLLKKGVKVSFSTRTMRIGGRTIHKNHFVV